MPNAPKPLNGNTIVIDEDTAIGGYRLRTFKSASITGTAGPSFSFKTKAELVTMLNTVFRTQEE